MSYILNKRQICQYFSVHLESGVIEPITSFIFFSTYNEESKLQPLKVTENEENKQMLSKYSFIAQGLQNYVCILAKPALINVFDLTYIFIDTAGGQLSEIFLLAIYRFIPLMYQQISDNRSCFNHVRKQQLFYVLVFYSIV